jgi:hypothetical protein
MRIHRNPSRMLRFKRRVFAAEVAGSRRVIGGRTTIERKYACDRNNPRVNALAGLLRWTLSDAKIGAVLMYGWTMPMRPLD